MKIVITSNPYRDRVFHCAKEIQKLLQSRGIDAPICLSFDADPDVVLPSDIQFSDLKKELTGASLLVCLGGDGTLLHASKYATFKKVPVLGVNTGTMGFMTELESSECGRILEFVEGEYSVEERMMLQVTVIREGGEVFREQALNDAVITKGAVARIIQLGVFCDNTEAMEFGGDGLIVSTPSGSTAYTMSAGGPIVEPLADNIIVTPVCAHSMLARPLVLSGGRTVDVKIGKIGKKNAFLSVDGGRAFRLNSGDRVCVERSQHKTRLVKLNGKSFFEILNQKLI